MVSFFEIMTTTELSGHVIHRRVPEAGETSKYYSVPGLDGYKHQRLVGFITSMTSNFCGTCNRLRIAADGNMKVCFCGNDKVSLRDMLRNGSSSQEIEHIVDLALYSENAHDAGPDMLNSFKNRPMILIGG